MRRRRSLPVLLVLNTLVVAPGSAYTVRVCQNKHCCKRNPNVLQTVHDLLGVSPTTAAGAASIDSSGCLSHCEHGPNVEVDLGKNDNHILNAMEDATMVALRLELALDTSFPKLLVAVAKVLERAEQSKGNEITKSSIFFS